ncbi:MAG TPA: N-6 DNA methylase [Mycobacteriales bacterium]|nr:N-6 DNA methylase [Mycobacteriales bacterium]
MTVDAARPPVHGPAYGPVHGEVFTRRWVVEVMLDLVGYTADRELAAIRLVEPACGSGAFLIPAVERLLASLGGAGIDETRLRCAVSSFDIQERNVQHCRHAVAGVLVRHGASPQVADRLARSWVRHEDYLLSARAHAGLFDTHLPADVDVVIGNPPYVRLEDVSDQISAEYRSRWPTMLGRADIFVGFYERALRSLKPGGRLGFICADRWMRNQYGAALRKLVADGYSVDLVWTMHDVDAFEALVSAYPAITVLSRQGQGSPVVAETDRDFGARSARELAQWTLASTLSATTGPGYRAFRLPRWFPGDELWPAGGPERLALVEHLNDRFAPLHDPAGGTRVGIGVATGADDVFVTTDDTLVERDRLLPLSMVADTRSGQLRWSGRYLVNPWAPDGTLVDLAAYPRFAGYLEGHRGELGRRYIVRNGRCWYQTIDKVNHAVTAQPKLLIQDMRAAINPVLDPGGHYPHHNLYYVVSSTWDMEVLGGLLLSRVAQAFIEAYCVRMRGNTLRFQAQYLKRIRVPRQADIPAAVRDSLRTAFRARDVAAATHAALDAYGLDHDQLCLSGSEDV